MEQQKQTSGEQRKSIPLNVIALFILGLVLSGIAFDAVWHLEKQRQDTNFQHDASNLANSLRRGINESLLHFESTVSFFESSQHVDRTEFTRFISNALPEETQHQTLLWAPFSHHSDTTRSFKKHANEDIHHAATAHISRLNSGPATTTLWQLPITFTHPSKQASHLINLDLLSTDESPLFTRDLAQPGSTFSLALNELTEGRPILTIARAVFPSNTEPFLFSQRIPLKGYLVSLIQLPELIQIAQSYVFGHNLRVMIFEHANDSRPYQHYPKTDESIKLTRDAILTQEPNHFVDTISYADLDLEIIILPPSNQPALEAPLRPWFALALGLLFTALLIAYFRSRQRFELTAQKHQQELEVRVEERTKALSTTNGILEQEILTRELSEKALIESEGKYRTLMTAMNDGVLVTREDRTLFWNPVIPKMLGYKVEEFDAYRFADLIAPEYMDDWMNNLHSIAHVGQSDSRYIEIELLLNYGEKRLWVECHSHPIRFGGEDAVLTILRNISTRKSMEIELKKLALYDSLTGLSNRTLFHDRLSASLTRSQRLGTRVAVMFIDLDNFKSINDSLGHSAGDEVLRKVADVLHGLIRESDTLSRIGGDEFTIILENISTVHTVHQIVEKVMAGLAKPIWAVNRELYVTASVGISLYPDHGDDVGTLLKTADLAMYQAKDDGRNTYQFFKPEMNDKPKAHMQMFGLLRRAIEENELRIHYQPKVCTVTGNVIGLEALTRWNDPDLGNVPPTTFIALAEETGLIASLGDWVLTTACKQAKLWQEEGINFGHIAVNLSPQQFLHTDLVELIKSKLDQVGLPAEMLEVEITESAIMRNIDRAVETLQGLHKLGVSLSIDDFGTGYSSLSYLKKFPLDCLKIDRSFIQDIHHKGSGVSIVAAVVSLAKNLNLKVVAEGVETQEQCDLITHLGCDSYQGYLFSKALPADKCKELLTQALLKNSN